MIQLDHLRHAQRSRLVTFGLLWAATSPPACKAHISAPSTCEAGQVINETACTLPHAVTAFERRVCDATGTGMLDVPCTPDVCEDAYAVRGTACEPVICVPSQAYDDVDCRSEITNSTEATGTAVCDGTGTEYLIESCTLYGCESGYIVTGNVCVAEPCTPSTSYGAVNCTESVAHATSATQSKTCNSAGTGYDYGPCIVLECEGGYVLADNNCNPGPCTPDVPYGTVDCTSDIAHAALATMTKTCNSAGTGYDYGTCAVQDCATDYVISGNTCTAVGCTPNAAYGTVDCQAEIPNSTIATKAKTCNGTGDAFLFGACAAETCEAGWVLSAGTCVAPVCPLGHVQCSTGCCGITALAGGNGHTCALTTAGGVKCWGRNDYGQLGDDSTTPSLVPIDANGLTSGVVAVAAGGATSCALLADGGVRCWGSNYAGSVGDGTNDDRHVPTAVLSVSGATAVATSGGHSCALVAGGEARCWGFNNVGQLGNGSSVSSPVAVPVTSLSGATALAAGGYVTCAVVSGTVQCWGSDPLAAWGSTPSIVAGISGATAITAGPGHLCAVIAGGAAKCWGYNFSGELGDGTTTASATPVNVSDLSGASSIVAGYAHTCALLGSGQVSCWGDWGRLGNGSALPSATPVAVTLPSAASALAAGDNHTCAAVEGDAAVCWGGNDGALGNGVASIMPSPVYVRDLTQATAVSVGEAFACALSSTGTVSCWGRNQRGTVGNGQGGAGNVLPLPWTLAGLTGVTAVDAGEQHACAVGTGGAVICWGDDESGQLGNGAVSSAIGAPAAVPDLAGVVDVAAGFDHTCAVLSSGAVKCWGANASGQLGIGGGPDAPSPTSVVGLADALTVAASYHFTCATTARQTVECWGVNDWGQLGVAGGGVQTIPVEVAGVSGADDVVVGFVHACALLSGGTVKCWGSDSYSQLGDQTAGGEVVGVTGAIALSAGYYHTCALLPAGSMKCWGDNDVGELGDGTTTTRSSPVVVKQLLDATALDAGGGANTCAVVSQGRVKCWGDDSWGQLGDENGSVALLPVYVAP